MRPSEVRRHVLRDHAELRERLERLEARARDVLAGRPVSARALRADGERLLDLLATHMSWEERYLVPVLREADGFGEVRCERFAEEHREQRELLAYALRKLHDSLRPDAVIAGNLLDLVELLHADMREEESVFLDERVLRDDPISIDLFTG